MEHSLPPIQRRLKQPPEPTWDQNYDPSNMRHQSEYGLVPQARYKIEEEPAKVLRENIKVVVRPRPLLDFELRRGDFSSIKVVSDTKIEVNNFEGAKQFKFNQVLEPSYTQAEAFHRLGVPSLLDTVIEGYSSTIMAYGQTGSGKTFTYC